MFQCCGVFGDASSTCVPSSSFAGNDELIAVEDSIDVGNVLYTFWAFKIKNLIQWTTDMGENFKED